MFRIYVDTEHIRDMYETYTEYKRDISESGTKQVLPRYGPGVTGLVSRGGCHLKQKSHPDISG